MMRASLILAVVLVAALALFTVACGDDDGGGAEAAEVEAAVQAAIDAWNDGDLDGFLAAFTDNGIQALFDASREDASEFLAPAGEPALQLGEFSATEVDGETATTEVSGFFVGALGTPQRFSLVLEGGVWLIDDREFLAGEVPEAATAVDLALSEFAFNFEPSDITGGNIAFNVQNIGGEPHEIGMARIAADADLEELVRSEEEEPPGLLEEVGFVGPFEAGSEATVLFTEPLEPGRYVLACFIEAADGEPHALKGMIAEFTIE
jgi:hypothetical protein